MLEDNGTPYIRWNGKWEPICGPHFKDSPEGANLFCQKMGYDGGSVKQTDTTYSKDSFSIGKCNADDVWGNCRGGCNKYTVGDAACTCEASQLNRISITCTGWDKVTRTSCGSKYL